MHTFEEHLNNSPQKPIVPLNLMSVDKLLENDKRREKDGFPRKIKLGKFMKPSKNSKNKIVVVPTTEEEKLIHVDPSNSKDMAGTGKGEEGDVIGEQPIEQEGSSGGAGGNDGGENHEIDSGGYEIGKILTEQFELPNLKDKGKKRSLTKFTYDMTDKNKGFGQLLDKKATLKQILKSNIGLGRVASKGVIDTSKLVVSPQDKVYRILSREKDFESQALVFFIRDYSGSMSGNRTNVVVSQHIMIYSWLLFQYANRVETRFILHDTEAKEVPDFYTYYNSAVSGGTRVCSAYTLVNEIVEKENLNKDYNIYIFHGTDGDDWDSSGDSTLPELEKICKYVSKMGLTIVRGEDSIDSEMERYLNSSFRKTYKKVFCVDAIAETADEQQIIKSIRRLLSST